MFEPALIIITSFLSPHFEPAVDLIMLFVLVVEMSLYVLYLPSNDFFRSSIKISN